MSASEDNALQLPDDVDPALWFVSAREQCNGGKDYLYDSHWLTHPGRMSAFCPHSEEWPDYRISLAELPADLPEATRFWVRGFLAGNLPFVPHGVADDSPEMIAWEAKALEFSVTGYWQYHDEDDEDHEG